MYTTIMCSKAYTMKHSPSSQDLAEIEWSHAFVTFWRRIQTTRGLLGLAWLEFYSVPRLSLLPPPGSGAQQGVDTLARLSLIETRDFTRQPQKGK